MHSMPLVNRRLHVAATLTLASSSLFAGYERNDFAVEFIDGDDVTLFQSSAFATMTSGKWESNLSVSASEFAVDYVPVSFDFLGSEVERREWNYALQLNSRKQQSDSLTLLFSAGAYDGFTNYRSVWLDEYFRQQFSDLPGVQGAEVYEQADPKGYNAAAGLRWMYLPATGYAQVLVSHVKDEISPGYEIDFEGLRRGNSKLETNAINLSTENILSERMRSLLTLRAAKTTERSWRYGAEAALNLSIGDYWTLRAKAGGATEAPEFDGTYQQLSIERAFGERTSVYLDVGHYEDSGEIENAFLFSNAAPGVENERAGIGLKTKGKNWNLRLYVALSDTRYDETGSNVDFFGNLYSDRDWTITQIAYSYEL